MAVTVENLRRYLRLPPPPAAPAAAGTADSAETQQEGAAEAAAEEAAAEETEAQSADSDPEMEAYLNAAVAWCSNAGVPYRANDPLYDLLILKIAAQEYDNRGLGFAGTDTRTSEETRQRMLNSFILNLRYAQTADTEATDA